MLLRTLEAQLGQSQSVFVQALTAVHHKTTQNKIIISMIKHQTIFASFFLLRFKYGQDYAFVCACRSMFV